MQGTKPLVIAISAVSGGGKTTISKCLNDTLHGSKALFFDDYEFESPDNILEWFENGADYNEWNLSSLLKDLEELLCQPLKYIVMDFPFAYLHSQIADLIDYAVFVDTPLDIALTRRLVRDFATSSIQDVMVDLQSYLSRGRSLYLDMLSRIKPNSDIVVDGTLPVPDIVELIARDVEQLAQKRP